MILTQLGDLGTGSAFVKLVNQANVKKEAMISAYLGYKVLVCIVFSALLVGSLLYYFLLDPRKEVLSFLLIVFASIFGVMTGFYASLLNAKQMYRSLSITKIFPPLLKSLLIIILFALGISSFGWLLFAFMTPALFGAMFGYYFIKYPIHLSSVKSLWSDEGKMLYQLSQWVCLYSLSQTIFSQIDVFMLKSMAGDKQVALFVSAQKLSTVILMLSQATFTVMLPKMENFKTTERILHFNKLNFYFFIGLSLLMVPAMVLCPLAVSLILGDQYLDSVPILRIFLFQTVGGMLISNQTLFFFRFNKMQWLAILSFVQLLLNAIGNYIFIPLYAAEGAIWVSTVLNNGFYLILMGITYYFAKNRFETPEHSIP